GNSRLWHATVMDWLHRYLGGAEADPKALETVYATSRWGARQEMVDTPARDLSALFLSRNPLVFCETVEEKRFEALVRAVANDLALPVWTWSAASGLSPCHPADQPKTCDLATALKEIRAASGD